MWWPLIGGFHRFGRDFFRVLTWIFERDGSGSGSGSGIHGVVDGGRGVAH